MIARQHQERGNQAYALRLLGEIAAHRAPPDVVTAASHYEQALTLAEELDMRPPQAHCHRGLGLLYAATSQWEQARAVLTATSEMYWAMDMTFWLLQTEAALAQVEGQIGFAGPLRDGFVLHRRNHPLISSHRHLADFQRWSCDLAAHV